MMRFEVAPEVFEKLPDACFGVVAVRGADNTHPIEEVSRLLHESIAESERRFSGLKVKELPEITPYRDAFRALDINPNKFMCSIEALLTRIAKGKGFPEISPVVDIGNAVSLKYDIPIGAHDMGTVERALEVRPAREGDTFVPFGGGEAEIPDPGEIVYVSNGQVRTPPLDLAPERDRQDNRADDRPTLPDRRLPQHKLRAHARSPRGPRRLSRDALRRKDRRRPRGQGQPRV